MILVCEIGDKTFFIGAIMAMQHPPIFVFAGAFGALIVMTVLSSLIGFALPNLLPKQYTHYAAAILFLYFGYVQIFMRSNNERYFEMMSLNVNIS